MADSYDMYRFLSAQGQQLGVSQIEALMDRGIEHVQHLWPVMPGDAVFYTLCRQPSLIDNTRAPSVRKALRDILAEHMTPAVIARWRDAGDATLRWLSWVFDPVDRPLASADLSGLELADNLLEWPPFRESPRWQRDDLPLLAQAVLHAQLGEDWPEDESYTPPTGFAVGCYDEGALLVESLPDAVIQEKRAVYAELVGNQPADVAMALFMHPASDWPTLFEKMLTRVVCPAFPLGRDEDGNTLHNFMWSVLPALPARWPKGQPLPDMSELLTVMDDYRGNIDTKALAEALIAWRELPPDYIGEFLPYLAKKPELIELVFKAVPALLDLPPTRAMCGNQGLVRKFSTSALSNGFGDMVRQGGLALNATAIGRLLRELATRTDTNWGDLASLVAIQNLMYPKDAMLYGALFPGVGFPGVLPVYAQTLQTLADPAQAWLLSTHGDAGVEALQVVRALALSPVESAQMLEGLLEKLPYLGGQPAPAVQDIAHAR